MLKREKETLLVPLYSRALENKKKNPIILDLKAEEILGNIEYDFSELKIPEKSALTLCVRAKKIDDYTRDFLNEYPEANVMHLGCGLDSRFQRVDNGKLRWFDLDYADVIGLRKRFYSESQRYNMISSSVSDLKWIQSVGKNDQPSLVIAEGLFMYLEQEDVKNLIGALQNEFHNCTLIFDAYSELTVKRIQKHPSLRKTGAEIFWGINDPKDIEKWFPGVRLVEEWYFTQYEDMCNLSLDSRILFKIASLFQSAKRAHRILYYSL